MPYTPGSLAQRGVTIYMTGVLCTQPAQIFQSPQAARLMQRFIGRLKRYDSALLSIFEGMELGAEDDNVDEAAYALCRILGLLVDLKPEEVQLKAPDVAGMVGDVKALATLVEELYDHWRGMERYLIFEGGAGASRDRALEGHVGFLHSNQDMTDLVRNAYRQIQHNLQGYWPRVYRQVPAGANMSLLIDRVVWPCPEGPYQVLPPVRMVRLAILNPPVVLYPRQNRRQGRFEMVDYNPLERAIIDPEKWLCMPVRVGTLKMLVYFDRDFLAHAVSLVNLLELSGHNEAREKPDAILLFGMPPSALRGEPTVVYEDHENELVLGAVAKSETVDYFGYFKKMLLTMHNVVMMRREIMPIHGAMSTVTLKEGPTSGGVIVGDSGAGKSETLEALRVMADEWLRDMKIIFDDMGSLQIDEEGRIIAYGTEIGAFVRLDDLDPGYAFGRIDRSILMNPHRQNARVVLPITEYEEVVAGHRVNMLLYANNYEAVDEAHPVIEAATSLEAALDVFRGGVRIGKGTTDETGLTATYFGNPFGPEQQQDRHEPIARATFEAAFRSGMLVGQIRTQLGIEGMEREGPMAAAEALFRMIGGK